MTNTDSPLDGILDKLHQQYEMEYGMHKKPLKTTKVKQAIEQYCHKQVIEARKTDEYGNPMIQLNMYEAEAVSHLIKNSDPQRFDTGDWFRDVPFKIEARLAELRKTL